MAEYTHRIRRGTGLSQKWCLVALNEDGTETDQSVTAKSVDDLLRPSRGLKLRPTDVVQIIHDTPEVGAA